MTTDSQTDASTALRQLYQGLILRHSARPRNYGLLAEATQQATVDNPLCGDTVTIYVQLAPPGLISKAGFSGDGCAIARASASMLTALVEGKTPAQARALASELQRFVSSKPPGSAQDVGSTEGFESLGELVALAGLRSVPSRRRCATLPWEALLAALGG